MDPFVGEIRIFGFNFAPKGWALCNGQILSISQNTALFSLLGTMYGGDGKSTFALPNLQGNAPVHVGQGPGLSSYVQGQTGGEDTTTLTQSQIPVHTHQVKAAADGVDGSANSPVGNAWAGPSADRGLVWYSANQATGTQMNPNASGVVGNSQPHNNMPPYLTLNFCIALQGVFPARS